MTDLRVLVVDDSAMYRLVIKGIIETIPDAKYIGRACDGQEALERIATEKPDVVTLDMEMPIMSGIDVIKAVTERNLNTKLIIVSSCSKAGAEAAINALELGAYDFITKPDKLCGSEAIEDIRQQLVKKFKILQRKYKLAVSHPEKSIDVVNGKQEVIAFENSSLPRKRIVAEKIVAPRSVPPSRLALAPRAIVVGCSTGGPKALLKLFSGLRCELGVPIFIVQHMPPIFTQTLAKSINDISSISVKEAEDGDKALPNHAYVAPGGRQMKLVHGRGGVEIRITDDESDNFCKPSVDYFFKSVAEIYKERALGIILSGMGSDGSEGLKKMKEHGVTVFGQDKGSCVVYGMPRVAQEAGLVDKELSIENMASAIEDVIKSSVKGSPGHASAWRR